AACTLRNLGSRASAAIPALIKLLADETPITRFECDRETRVENNGIHEDTSPGKEAAKALAAIGAEAVEPPIGALRGGEAPARANAAFALGLINDPRVVEPLIAALSDSYWTAREKAAWSLGLRGDNRAIEPLSNALKDSAWQVRAQAAWALGLKG